MQHEFGIHMKGGVITERDPDFATGPDPAPAGCLTAEQLAGIAKLSKRYRTRRWFTVPHARPSKSPMSNLPCLKDWQNSSKRMAHRWESERDEIVNIISCPGTERCQFANIDTISLAKKIDEKLFGKVMPVKMRIGISGCPNACVSPMLNEIGVIGRMKPIRTPGLCTGCGFCVYYCKENAIKIRNGNSELNEEKCVQCGMCVKSCWFNLLKSAHSHYLITVGGRRGRHPKIGRELMTVETEDQVLFAIEKIIDWVYRRAWSGRLLSEQLDELNFEKFREEILKQMPGSSGSGISKN